MAELSFSGGRGQRGATGYRRWCRQRRGLVVRLRTHPHVGRQVRGGHLRTCLGDFDGDRRSDILWYGSWNANDVMWAGTSVPGSFTNRSMSQAGSFLPVTGDFNGDGRSDIFWYQPGGDPLVADACCSGSNYEPNARHDQLWLAAAGGGWSKRDLSMPGTAIPLAGDFDGDGTTDIIWFQPGVGADSMWRFRNGVPTKVAVSITGDYRPVVGDFDGDGIDDLFWYGPGAKSDYIWWFDSAGRHSSVADQVTKENYRPLAGNFDGDPADELFWYTPGTGADYIWKSLDRAGHPVSVSHHRERGLHTDRRRLRREPHRRRDVVFLNPA